MENELERISSRAEYSPVLLTWMLINYIDAKESTSLPKRCQQLGEKAIEHRVMKVISDIANDSVVQVIIDSEITINSSFDTILLNRANLY